MKVLALDASVTKTGWAVTHFAGSDGQPDGTGLLVPPKVGLIKPPSKLKKQNEKLLHLYKSVEALITFERPEMIVIEECGPQRNAKVFRALVRAEDRCQHAADMHNIEVMLVMVKAVREVTFGDGKTGKSTAYAKMVERWPDFAWLPEEKGGDDMSDALAMALAAPRLAARR